MDEIHAAFPDKPIVISEYGYCACTAERPEGDARRREIMRTHDAALKARDYIAGLIFFCYNDYRMWATAAWGCCDSASTE
jgi:beta-glucuronidase